MATLTHEELLEIRNTIERKCTSSGVPVRWTKDAIAAIAQAIETRLENSSSIISSDIDDASLPFGISLIPQEKVWITAFVLRSKFKRDSL